MSTQRLAVTTMILDWREDGIYVLAVTRKNNSDQWCLPGGKVDAAETMAEAAARELREETGVWVNPNEHLMPLYTAMDDGNYLCTTFITTTRDMSDDIKLRPESGTQVAWVPLSFLRTHSPFTAYYEKMFRHLDFPSCGL
jgi:8-oxo-dGTP diphosphatase